ncbi:hypothetical protein CERSUDRAFT_95080 [Gelatoporia subvermispora B]|uniref:Uncharacterized protein n=1 Tax=Ceriporiopsis subvermispora (strain B) TaxID=914234 RepID=M2PKI8_CERS8|nr:hypothetical protein CERSUDRAFT_95080 [Gelatoporia subvermispora B]
MQPGRVPLPPDGQRPLRVVEQLPPLRARLAPLAARLPRTLARLVVVLPAVHPLPRPSRRRGDRERRDDLVGSSTTKQLLSRLLAQEEHEAQSTRSVVVALSERLERETRRADEAERRVVDVLHRLRTAHEATLLAQADTARAREELRLHAMRLEEAQGEIRRAQDIVDALERQRNEAEEEAARARTSVRKYRERELVARAREQGRREGYQEGFARGQDMGYYEAAAAGGEQGVYAEQAMGDTYSEDGPEEIHINYDRGAASQPVWRPPSRSSTSGISRRSPPTITIQVPSPPSRPSTTRADRTTATHDPDLAIHAATLPVPTLTSPLRMPSPSHAQPPSPTPALVPTSSNRHSRDSDDLHPIAIHRATPEPVHPPYQIPPDNWIPLEGSPIPPQHEFAELHSPRSRSPSLTDMAPQPVQSYEPSVRSRDYAYAQGAVPIPPPGNNNLLFSPSSRTSTRISEYELLRDRRDTGPRPPRTPGMPEDLRQVFRSPGPSSERPRTPVRQDLRPPSPRGPRTQESPAPLPVPAPFAGGADDYGRGRQRRPHHTRAEGSSLERMFKKRFHERERNSGSSGGVPDIYVESPSSGEHTPETAHPVTEPHMLSPDSTPAPLPVLPPEDPIPIRIEGPDEVPDDTRPLPPLPAGETDYRDAVMVPAPGEQYPVGFVPLQFTPNAEPPTPLSPKDTTTTIPHISHEPAGSPRYTPRYAEAPMPAGLVYPDPLGKSPASGAANAVPLPSSPKSSTSSRRRRGSVAARALSPLQLQLFSSLRSNDSIASLTEQNIGRRIT